MTWKAYRLVYRAKSPIHIGYRTLGFIQRTRYYIPGRALWGAFTANLTRAYGSYADYKGVDDYVRENLRFSYFYPALDIENPLLPRFTSKGMGYASPDEKTLVSEEEFERVFIGSFGQTAIAPESNTAAEGSLHETEFISPVVEWEGQQKPVCFIGYLFIKEKDRTPRKDVHLTWDSPGWGLKMAIQEVFIGGERKYGFGRLILEESSPVVKEKDGNLWLFGSRLIYADKEIEIIATENQPIPAHLDLAGARRLRGDIEPLVGREWREHSGAGQIISPARLCWMPGSIVSNGTMRLVISDYGVLRTGAGRDE